MEPSEDRLSGSGPGIGGLHCSTRSTSEPASSRLEAGAEHRGAAPGVDGDAHGRPGGIRAARA